MMFAPADGALAQTASRAGGSVWDGVYSEDQAARGNIRYQQHCGRCHGANLAGTFETPPLVGRFIPYWAGTTLDMLFDYVSSAMPLDRPGSLAPGVNADILAFILKTNGFPAGTGELSPAGEDQRAIRFDAARPPATNNNNSARAR